jgi:hypothetical protein
MEERSASASLDYAAKAAQLWAAFDGNERSGVAIGVFPFEKMSEAEREGYESRQLAVALMRVARSEPVQTTRSRRHAPERFPLGRTVATPGALEVLEAGGASPLALLARHQSGDWGDVPPEDATENEISIERGFRILSSYAVGHERLWVITEADRSVTTILKPAEY